MIFYDTHYPVHLTGAALDGYLARGWYRMQQTIFTTDVILKDNRLLPVFWLRLNTESYQPSKKHLQLLAINQSYMVEIVPADITDEMEQLYQLYKAAMNFNLYETLQDSLSAEGRESIYDTQCITIRHEGNLVAAGFFDKGETTIAGIINIYHPAYARQQLGKYLVLLKIAYAKQQQFKYYYTGYLSTADSKFDYKLFAGRAATEVFYRKQNQWLPWLSVQKEELEEWLINETMEGGIRLPPMHEL